MHRLFRRLQTIFGLDIEYFARSSLWLAYGQVVSGAAAAVTMILLARTMSVTDYGVFQFALSVVGAAAIFTVPGASTAIIRSAAQGKYGSYPDSVRLMMKGSLVGAFAVLLAGGVYGWVHGWELVLPFVVLGLTFPAYSGLLSWVGYNYGREWFKQQSMSMVLRSVLVLLGVAVVVYLLGITGLLLITLVYFGLMSISNLFFTRQSLRTVREGDEKDDQFIGYSKYLTKLNIAGLLSAQADKILMAFFLGPTAVGVYSVLSLAAFRYKDMTKGLGVVIIPKIARSKKGVLGIIRQKAFAAFAILALSGVLAAAYYVLIPYAIALLFGEQYAPVAAVARQFTIAVFLMLPVALLSYAATAKKEEKILLYQSIHLQVVRGLLVTALLPIFGMVGAIWAYNLHMVLTASLYAVWGLRARFTA